jgi:cobalamin biosynthesis Mg chelatase CobN
MGIPTETSRKLSRLGAVLPTEKMSAASNGEFRSEGAWRVSQQLVREALDRYREEEGRYPETVGRGNVANADARRRRRRDACVACRIK